MATVQEIKKKLKIASLMERISSAYQEISRQEMNKIREMTLKNREFIEELLQVYAEAKEVFLMEAKEEGEKILLPPKKRVVVFLSANARFYGGLVLEVWRKVLEYLTKNEADLVVVGEIGKYLSEQIKFQNQIYYFSLDDENPKEKEIREISNFLKDYSEIKIFHGKFKSILFQEVVFTDISGRISQERKKEFYGYLFEPSPQAVLDFFKTELISAFFSQAFLEHRLSRHATRMVQMYKTNKKAKERKEILKREERRLKWRKLDRKQQEISLISQLWK